MNIKNDFLDFMSKDFDKKIEETEEKNIEVRKKKELWFQGIQDGLNGTQSIDLCIHSKDYWKGYNKSQEIIKNLYKESTKLYPEKIIKNSFIDGQKLFLERLNEHNDSKKTEKTHKVIINGIINDLFENDKNQEK